MASRTTTSTCAPPICVDTDGWAHFDYVKMPDYRWGIFLAEPEPDRDDRLRRPHRAAGVARGARRVPQPLRRLIVTQGDTEPASRRAAAHARHDRAVAVRPAQPVPGQRRGRPPPVGDGVPAAHVLRPRRPRGGRGAARSAARANADKPRILGAFNEPIDGLALVLHVHDVHRPRRQVPAAGARRERRSIRSRAPAGSC